MTTPSPATRPPKVLFLMCDQLRHDWLGYRAADFVRTPHIDALSAEARVFTQATATSPVCAPARIGLATGVRPHRMGSLNNHSFLPLSKRTYYQQLRDHGYHVGCCGKLDLAKPDGYNGRRGERPLTYAWGFTHPSECEGKMHAGRGDPPNGPYTQWLHDKDPALHAAFTADYRERRGGAIKRLAPSVLPTVAFEDVYIGQTSATMIRDMDPDFPWHLFVSFVGPHNPFDPPAEYAKPYAEAEVPAAIPYEPDGRPPRYGSKGAAPTLEEIRTARRLYAAYIECIDDQIGTIMTTLEETGQREDTYILFAADHGEMLGDHGRWTKSCQYEAAVRVPLFVSGPGIAPGVSDAPVELSDLAPTILEMAGVPPLQSIDAQSVMPLLRGETESHRDWAMATHLGHGCLRTPAWKLILGEYRNHELFDLVNDPEERRNVIAEHPERAVAMEEIYWREWFGGPHH